MTKNRYNDSGFDNSRFDDDRLNDPAFDDYGSDKDTEFDDSMFDDNFEVTYIDDDTNMKEFGNSSDETNEKLAVRKSSAGSSRNASSGKGSSRKVSSGKVSSGKASSGKKKQQSSGKNSSRQGRQNAPESASSSERKQNRKQNTTANKKRAGKNPMGQLAKGGGNVVKAGGKAVKTTAKYTWKTVQFIAHLVSLGAIAAIIFTIGKNFLQNASAYGSIPQIVSDENYMLAGFLGVGALLLIFEIISFLWALSRPRTSNKIIGGHEDIGRGLFSFVVILAGSYLAAMFGRMIPELHEALSGVKAGVTLYGTIRVALLPLCIIGIVSCIVRRFSSK